MATTKTVFYKGNPVQGSTIADFYQRLNVLRGLGNLGNLTVFNPAGQNIKPSDISSVQTNIINTKNALSFLSSVNISSFTPTTPTSGTLISAGTNVAKIEKEIGTLESACFTFKNGNRSTFFGNNATANTYCSTFCQTIHSTVRASVHNSFCSAVNTTHKSGFCSTVNSSFFSSVTSHSAKHITFNGTHHGTFHSSVRSSGKSYHYWLFHSGNGFCSAGKQDYKSQHNSSHYKTNGTKTSHHSSYKGSHHAGFFSSVKNAANFGTFHQANYTPNFATNQLFCVTNHGTFFQTVKSNHCTAFKNTNLSVVHTNNFAFNVNFKTNHSTFRVEFIDF